MKAGLLLVFAVAAIFSMLQILSTAPMAGMTAKGAIFIGGTAYSLMAMAIFLSTRPKFLENIFGGLDQIYHVHKITALTAFGLALVHFLLVPKDLPAGADLALNSTKPSAPFGMIALILLVINVIITLNRKVPYNKWRNLHRLMGLVFILLTGHFITAPPAFFENGLPRYYLLLMATIGIVSFLAGQFGLTRRNYYLYEIVEGNHLERATEIVMKPKSGAMRFLPGQFITMQIEADGYKESHPFTISSAPSEDNLRITAKVLGDWTRKLRAEVPVGADVKIQGPYGRFLPQNGGKKQLWIAGGVGITPFLSNIRAMEKGGDKVIDLYYGVREKSEALFFNEIEAKAKKLGNVKTHLLESNNGEFIKVEDIEKAHGNLAEYDVYLCGPKPMIDQIVKDLKKAGVDSKNIHHEFFEFR